MQKNLLASTARRSVALPGMERSAIQNAHVQGNETRITFSQERVSQSQKAGLTLVDSGPIMLAICAMPSPNTRKCHLYPPFSWPSVCRVSLQTCSLPACSCCLSSTEWHCRRSTPWRVRSKHAAGARPLHRVPVSATHR